MVSAFVLLLASTFLPPSTDAQSRAGAAPAPSTAQLTRIAALEDARGRHGRDLSELFPYLSHGSPEIRAAAVRALGRQQSPELLTHIYPSLRDRSPAVRGEAANALGQALQGFRSGTAPAATSAIADARDSLLRAATERGASPELAGVSARTIGRLPYRDSGGARAGEAAILHILSSGPRADDRQNAPLLVEGVMHGLYTLARARRTLGMPAEASRTAMAGMARFGLGGRSPGTEAAARVRRLSLLGTTASGAANARVLWQALDDPDEQVRRLALAALATLPDTTGRRAAIDRGLVDRSPLVRLEAVRASRAFAAPDGCGALIAAVGDTNVHVVLAAIDGMSSACRDGNRVADTLLSLIDANRSDSPVRSRGRSGWHVHAHALVALARTTPDRAAPLVRRDARESTLWTVRVYAARAAAVLGDTATLTLLARDRHGNVRQEALGSLVTAAGHVADRLFVAALGAPEYHVVMEAAQALRGAPLPDSIVPSLLQALDRVSAERKETSRDARIALIERIEELGSVRHAPRLQAYRSDFDTTVARRAAAVLSRWNGRETAATAVGIPPQGEAIAPLMTGEWRARVTMAATTGGGSFEIALAPRLAPFTVARFVRLARSGYYNGLTFHRVEPAFVIQGGSPAANEYVGDGAFMRDELGLRSHTRGTLGISTRGRDTGDAQIFVNLVDNFRLDHDYTVFGEIVKGRDVAERVLEADVIERIEIVRLR
ncbi:MAG: peptidylprolyl isomerase [Gemmatimonadaceae bacterium]